LKIVPFIKPFYVAAIQISIADGLKKRFHAACVLRGLKMSQVIADLIEQWLKTYEAQSSSEFQSKETLMN
jgi:ParG